MQVRLLGKQLYKNICDVTSIPITYVWGSTAWPLYVRIIVTINVSMATVRLIDNIDSLYIRIIKLFYVVSIISARFSTSCFSFFQKMKSIKNIILPNSENCVAVMCYTMYLYNACENIR